MSSYKSLKGVSAWVHPSLNLSPRSLQQLWMIYSSKQTNTPCLRSILLWLNLIFDDQIQGNSKIEENKAFRRKKSQMQKFCTNQIQMRKFCTSQIQMGKFRTSQVQMGNFRSTKFTCENFLKGCQQFRNPFLPCEMPTVTYANFQQSRGKLKVT